MLSKALLSGLALATLLVTGTTGLAETPRRVRLEYQRQEGAAACPDEAVIRAGVAGRLGYEPFRANAPDLLRASLRPAGQMLEARIELFDAQGNLRASRRLTSRKRDCSELAASVELAIAIAIDPMGSPPPADEAAPPPGAERTMAPENQATAAAAPPSVPRSAPSARSFSSRAQVGMVGGWGSAPSLSLGFTVGGALESDGWSVGIEGRADLPSSMALREGEASGWLLVASLVPCLRFGVLSTCALATGGARQVAGDGLLDARHATVPYFAFGARLAAALPLAKRVALGLHGDVTTPVTQIRLTVDDGVVWTSPAIAVALGLGVAIVLP